MDASHAAKPSSQEMEAGFDLLVADVTEYAIFLIGPGGRLLCWNPDRTASSATSPPKSSGSTTGARKNSWPILRQAGES
jgi:hypothetical protein